MLCTYDDWSSCLRVFNHKHHRAFTPCVILDAFSSNRIELVDLLSIEREIDVSCTAERGEDFSGNPLYREKVMMKVASFASAFQKNARSDQPHWLQSSSMNLYLSQCSIFSSYKEEPAQVPELYAKVSIPPVILLSQQHQSQRQQSQQQEQEQLDTSLCQINMWMNIKPCRSTLHYDNNHNILHVLQGCKECILFSPKCTALLAPMSAFAAAPNHSHLSCDDVQQLVDELLFEKSAPSSSSPSPRYSSELKSIVGNFRSLINFETDLYICTLRAGEALFIPEGWWHQVSSGTCTWALNYWFRSPLYPLLQENMSNMLPYITRVCMQQISAAAATNTLSQSISTEPKSLVKNNSMRYAISSGSHVGKNSNSNSNSNNNSGKFCKRRRVTKEGERRQEEEQDEENTLYISPCNERTLNTFYSFMNRLWALCVGSASVSTGQSVGVESEVGYAFKSSGTDYSLHSNSGDSPTTTKSVTAAAAAATAKVDEFFINFSHEQMCLIFVRCQVPICITMRQYWLPYARKNANKWTKVLLSLTPESCFHLNKTWDQLSVLEATTLATAGQMQQGKEREKIEKIKRIEGKEEIYTERHAVEEKESEEQRQIQQQGFEKLMNLIFEPCGEAIPAIRRHIITQSDLWMQVKSLDMLHTVVGL